MAWRDNRDRIAAIGSTHRTNRRWLADLPRNRRIAARFTEWDSQQRLPDTFLKISSPEIQRNAELPQLTSKIGEKLAPGLDKDRMRGIIRHETQTNPLRQVIGPKKGNQFRIAGDQRELSHG